MDRRSQLQHRLETGRWLRVLLRRALPLLLPVRLAERTAVVGRALAVVAHEPQLWLWLFELAAPTCQADLQGQAQALPSHVRVLVRAPSVRREPAPTDRRNLRLVCLPRGRLSWGQLFS